MPRVMVIVRGSQLMSPNKIIITTFSALLWNLFSSASSKLVKTNRNFGYKITNETLSELRGNLIRSRIVVTTFHGK